VDERGREEKTSYALVGIAIKNKCATKVVELFSSFNFSCFFKAKQYSRWAIHQNNRLIKLIDHLLLQKYSVSNTHNLFINSF
jgi:hypothetical protein